ncbi:di-trans,poly-cis-decaprenylcistransferase [Treponema parvum]|uniref:Isoprenyl transferase n=1 Tax=Treponema parvum TaxID=138851 RepID=A0A975F4M3_9SPIR|nr:polyprenyl diphosphate synthase [Treponema parvum]QTQ13959.1 di-trans,poly-cis-decaprenylcistransferase [Treponema parvum]
MPDTVIKNDCLPVHIGIIMDGNGRWAKNRKLPRTFGHKEGLTAAKKIVAEAAKLGIRYVTLYTFSTENWKRTQEEVGYLMNLIKGHLRAEFEFYKQNGIRIKHIGDLSGLSEDIQTEIVKAMEETSAFTGMTVVLAVNYGGRNEIIRGIKKLSAEDEDFEALTEERLSRAFDIPELPDVDLLIRTGGEYRLSNFLLWHAAYAELLFTDTLWPDYNEDEFKKNIIEYQKRNRRFGAVLSK